MSAPGWAGVASMFAGLAAWVAAAAVPAASVSVQQPTPTPTATAVARPAPAVPTVVRAPGPRAARVDAEPPAAPEPGPAPAPARAPAPAPLVLRFAQGSAALDEASGDLLDGVAATMTTPSARRDARRVQLACVGLAGEAHGGGALALADRRCDVVLRALRARSLWRRQIGLDPARVEPAPEPFPAGATVRGAELTLEPARAVSP